MAIDVRRKKRETGDDELELLWRLPASSSSRPAPSNAAPSTLYAPILRLVGYAWPAVIGSIMFFHPATSPAAEDWAYTGWATAGLFAALGLALLAHLSGRRTGALAASVVAGSVGLVLAYQCRVTAQHYGNWWVYELVAFGALTALSVAALALGTRRTKQR